MKCPLTAKCQKQLAGRIEREVRERVAAKEQALVTEADLRETIAIQRYEIESLRKFCRDNTTDRARRESHAYQFCYHVPEHPCRSCDHIFKSVMKGDRPISQCASYNHTVSRNYGTCPKHTALEAAECELEGMS